MNVQQSVMQQVRLRDIGISPLFGLGVIVAAYYAWLEMASLRLWKTVDLALITGLPHFSLFGVIRLVLGLAMARSSNLVSGGGT
ncbi:hypothetical protein EU538_02305 [Candidatus Thorarchaeota archaeon]|nr:MAG: hypothetical protein EU538_02305 [Candidatus Thorarchaeota archaeon]